MLYLNQRIAKNKADRVEVNWSDYLFFFFIILRISENMGFLLFLMGTCIYVFK